MTHSTTSPVSSATARAPRKRDLSLRPGDSLENALAGLFEVRYPMAQDAAPHGAPKAPTRKPGILSTD